MVDEEGQLVGIISESDLMNREGIGTEVHHPWWIEAVPPAATPAKEFAKSHGKRVKEVMSDKQPSSTAIASHYLQAKGNAERSGQPASNDD